MLQVKIDLIPGGVGQRERLYTLNIARLSTSDMNTYQVRLNESTHKNIKTFIMKHRYEDGALRLIQKAIENVIPGDVAK